jgi:hypothetical protein
MLGYDSHVVASRAGRLFLLTFILLLPLYCFLTSLDRESKKYKFESTKLKLEIDTTVLVRFLGEGGFSSQSKPCKHARSNSLGPWRGCPKLKETGLPWANPGTWETSAMLTACSSVSEASMIRPVHAALQD